MQAVTSLEQTFDWRKILFDMPAAWKSHEFLNIHYQLAFSHSPDNPDWFDGIGSLVSEDYETHVKFTNDYTVMNEALRGTYLEEVINTVKAQAEKDGVQIGRIRLMMLRPKVCYSYHKDPEEFRYHIPVVTHHKCFFVVDDEVVRMSEVGRLYKFHTNEYHTAINASRDVNRFHIVFDTY